MGLHLSPRDQYRNGTSVSPFHRFNHPIHYSYDRHCLVMGISRGTLDTH